MDVFWVVPRSCATPSRPPARSRTARPKLNALFTDVTAFSDTARDFLDAERRQHHPAQPGRRRSSCAVLAQYSPEFPCLPGGIVNAGKLQAEAFRGFTLHIVLETLPNQPRGYTAADLPRLGDDRGPNCLHLPNPPWNQSNPVRHQPNFNDGVDQPTGKGTDRVAPSYYRTADRRRQPGQEADLLSRLLGPAARRDRRRRARPRGPARRARWRAGAEVSLR